MTKLNKVLIIPLLIGLSFFGGCGGGGGGGDDEFVGAGEVTVRTQPSVIDPGDHTQVTVSIAEVHKNGVALKLRYPEGLVYVPDSSILSVEQTDKKLTPDFNGSDGKYVYLVYFLEQKTFGAEGKDRGYLTFELRAGDEEIREGEVEVALSVLDPDLPGGTGFDVENPLFSTRDSAPIKVRVND